VEGMSGNIVITAIAVALIVVGIIYKIVARKTKRGRGQKEQFDNGN